MSMGQRLSKIIPRITCNIFGKEFKLLYSQDKIYGGRYYIFFNYESECTKTGNIENWNSRKWYLSEYMTDDEIVKTCYAAFEMCIKHEILEGFKVDGITLFNPHVNFEELLSISNREVFRKKV